MAVTVGGSAKSRDVWAYDIPRGTLTRLTFEGDNFSPVWTPDGKRIAFSTERNRAWSILWKPADGSGMEETLVPPQNYFQIPHSWSPDGKFLAYTVSDPRNLGDLWILPLEGERKPKPFLQTKFDEFAPMFSPDGRWLAYVSNESSRYEVYVQPFPGPGGKWQVSTEGGTWPLWGRDGRELFYLNGNKIMSAAVATHPTFTASHPRVVVETHMENPGPPRNGVFDVGDGQRFVIVKPSGEKAGLAEIRIVLGWLDELRRHASAGRGR